jgi:hypothetical protein
MRRFILAIAVAAAFASSTVSAFAHPSEMVRVDGHWVTEAHYGQSWTGGLDRADETASDGSRVEWFRFQGRQGDCALITMQSRNIDSYLELRLDQPGGRTLQSDDDSGGGSNSRIRARLPFDGYYYIWVGSFGRGQDTGDYTLSLSRVHGCR